MKLARFAVGMLWTNCYVLSSRTGHTAVIDPGGPMDDACAYIEKEGLSIDWILLTHGHTDHISGLGEVRSRAAHGAAICAGDELCITNARENLSSDFGHKVEFSGADHILKDGEIIKIGDMTVEVIETPGHTQGSCCFFAKEEEQALLISGDTLFARSIGRTDLPGGDESTLMDSLLKLERFPDELPVFPGHGPATTIGEERSLNPFWPSHE